MALTMTITRVLSTPVSTMLEKLRPSGRRAEDQQGNRRSDGREYRYGEGGHSFRVETCRLIMQDMRLYASQVECDQESAEPDARIGQDEPREPSEGERDASRPRVYELAADQPAALVPQQLPTRADHRRTPPLPVPVIYIHAPRETDHVIATDCSFAVAGSSQEQRPAIKDLYALNSRAASPGRQVPTSQPGARAEDEPEVCRNPRQRHERGLSSPELPEVEPRESQSFFSSRSN